MPTRHRVGAAGPEPVFDEVDRFWSKVVRGPLPGDCWLWTGAISTDGYGRFWTSRPGPAGQMVHRPHRYAYTLVTGVALTPTDLLMHDCDIPLCVHATATESTSHVLPGDHRANMIDRSRKGRHANGASTWRWRGISRQRRAELSRDLRETVLRHGWDRDRIHAVLTGAGLDGTPTLF